MNKIEFNVIFMSVIKKVMGSSNLLPNDAASCIFPTSTDDTYSSEISTFTHPNTPNSFMGFVPSAPIGKQTEN